jgi:hypothetical protein
MAVTWISLHLSICHMTAGIGSGEKSQFDSPAAASKLPVIQSRGSILGSA